MGLLARRGHVVIIAQHGGEALARLANETFDVVLMDLQMPVMDGIDATVAIRARERLSGGRVRIVAMTAHATNSDRERCLAAGMDSYLSKPIDPQLLFAAVEQEQESTGGADMLADVNPSAGPTALDEGAMLKRCNGDTELLADVIRAFLDDCPAQLAAINAAVISRNPEALRAAAHALKGATDNLSGPACSARPTCSNKSAPNRGWRPPRLRGDDCRSKPATSSTSCADTKRPPRRSRLRRQTTLTIGRRLLETLPIESRREAACDSSRASVAAAAIDVVCNQGTISR